MGGHSTAHVKAIEKNALDGRSGIEKESRLLSKAKGHGKRESVGDPWISDWETIS